MRLEIAFCMLVGCGTRTELDERPVDARIEESSDAAVADVAIDVPREAPAPPIPVCPMMRSCVCGDEDCSFDRGSCAAALVAVDLSVCKEPNGPTGSGHVKITFVMDGTVSDADVDAPPFAGTSVGACIAARFRAVCMKPYCGAPVTVGKSFSL